MKNKLFLSLSLLTAAFSLNGSALIFHPTANFAMTETAASLALANLAKRYALVTGLAAGSVYVGCNYLDDKAKAVALANRPMYKKAFDFVKGNRVATGAAVAAIAGLGYGAYKYFNRPTTTLESKPETEPTTTVVAEPKKRTVLKSAPKAVAKRTVRRNGRRK